jgi:hypothetical protein
MNPLLKYTVKYLNKNNDLIDVSGETRNYVMDDYILLFNIEHESQRTRCKLDRRLVEILEDGSLIVAE